MIDGLKFSIDPEAVSDSDILEFKPFGNRQQAKYHGLIIDHYGHSCNVRGSIHKYSNEGEHNADDFTLSRYIDTLYDLCLTLNIKPDRCKFHSIEFGVNIELPFDVSQFIDSIIYLRKGFISRDKLGITIKFSEYRVKVYLKSQNGAPDKLRFEIAVNKTRRIRNISKSSVSHCETLADLTNSKLWEVMGSELLSVFDDILIVDVNSVDIEELNKKDLKLWVKGQNPSYWLSKQMNSKQRRRHLERFKRIIDKHAKYDYKGTVRALISDKIKCLIDMNTQPVYTPNFHILSDSKMSTNHHWCKKSDKSQVSTNHHRWNTAENNELSTNHTLDEWGNMDTDNRDNRRCEITNLSLDIGINQGSYLSPKGVEYYYKKHREVYDDVLGIRLSDRWKNKPLEVQFAEIAHSIRNEKYNKKNNPRNNLRNSIRARKRHGRLLFSLEETICPSKREMLRQISYT